MNFKNKTIMVTGAAGNLGRAVGNAFHQLGGNLVLVDRQIDGLQRAFGKEQERCALVAVDLLNQAQVKDAVESAVSRFGRIDVLCNVAGGFRMGPPVHETPDQDWNFLFDLNSRSLMHAVRAVVPGMLAARGGKIVNIAANAAQKGVAGMGAYCASKDVVIRMTEAMAAELRDSNINVNCVMPSIIDTPENRAAMPGADFSRWVAPEALADVIVFLASDGARAIHGAALPVVGRS